MGRPACLTARESATSSSCACWVAVGWAPSTRPSRSLSRHVALKLLTLHAHHDARQSAGSLREAKSAVRGSITRTSCRSSASASTRARPITSCNSSRGRAWTRSTASSGGWGSDLPRRASRSSAANGQVHDPTAAAVARSLVTGRWEPAGVADPTDSCPAPEGRPMDRTHQPGVVRGPRRTARRGGQQPSDPILSTVSSLPGDVDGASGGRGPQGVGRTGGPWRGSGCRWPMRWNMPTGKGSFTATSSPRTCCWISAGPSG